MEDPQYEDMSGMSAVIERPKQQEDYTRLERVDVTNQDVYAAIEEVEPTPAASDLITNPNKRKRRVRCVIALIATVALIVVVAILLGLVVVMTITVIDQNGYRELQKRVLKTVESK